MAAFFDSKAFNPEVFGRMYETISDLNRNELIRAGAFRVRNDLVTDAKRQTGGNYIVDPLKDSINSIAVNYDGSTDITSDGRDTFTQGMIVIGRAAGNVERDFSSDITGGENFLPVARELAHYWDNVDQGILLSILKGIFSMTGAGNTPFVNNHTFNIAASATNNTVNATTLNTAIQKALGDNKNAFSVAIMHSAVATNLENLSLLEYLKYTDERGIQRDLTLGTWNGRTVLVDDNMPVEEKVEGDDTYMEYTTYILGRDSFYYADMGVQVPFEMARDPKINGGETTLYSRQRKLLAPKGISFETPSILSPTNAQLENGANWSLVHNGATPKKYINHKHIPIARIISRG